jgi:cytochrome c553
MRDSRVLFAILASGALSGAIAADPDYSFCTVCHGAQGNGNPAINAPKIAGIEPWYLKRQLQHFRAGLRGTQTADVPGAEMQPVGLGLDDSAIEKAAAYIGTFEPQRPPATVTGDAKRGRNLYAPCAGCHGANGEGNVALQAPALAGQTDWYLVTQLERFRAGERGFSPQDEPGTQMRTAAAVLPDEAAIKDVVAYVNSLTAGRSRT